MNGFDAVKEIAKMTDGTINEVGILPDGSGFATMSMPLPKDHWLTKDPDGFNVPPMPMRMGKDNPIREVLAKALKDAGRYAVRCATMNGKDNDFDPDALIQNLIVGFFGYHTEDALSDDDWANPKPYNKDDGTIPKNIDDLIQTGRDLMNEANHEPT